METRLAGHFFVWARDLDLFAALFMSNAAKPKRSDSPAAKTVERDRNIDETMRSVSDELEEQIVLGVLNPRERLGGDDLCERFNLKRHVARHVLAWVERRCLVVRR